MLPINNPDGFHQKYKVTKTDGSPCDPKAVYLVLRLDGTSFYSIASRMAAKVYAENTPAKKMGDDLVKMIKRLGDESWAKAEAVADAEARVEAETAAKVVAKAKFAVEAKTKTWGAVMAETEVAAKAWDVAKANLAAWAKAAITARSKAKGETMVAAEAAVKAEAWAASKIGEEAWADAWDEITDWAAT